ncbi:MAG: mannosyltransferase family protein [Chthoniobacterales bacterium]
MNSLHHVPPAGAWEIGASGDGTFLSGPVSTAHYPLVNMWSRWDGGWYHNIAARGYKFTTEAQTNVAFLPVYPMLLRATHAVVHSRKGVWWLVCGIVVSNAALLGALIYLFLLARLEFDEPTARRAVLYLLIFPTTLFLSAVYSESVFLLFIIGSFYHARRQQWWRAGLLASIAALCRPPGVLIFVGLFVEYFLQCEFNFRKLRWNALSMFLPPLALGGYFAYLHYAVGTAAAVVEAQGTWGMGIQGQWRTIAPFFQRDGHRVGTYSDLAFTLSFVGLVIAIALRLRVSYAAYAIVYLIFITMWGSLESVPRYVLGIFPAILLLARWGRHRTFDRIWVPASAALAAILMAVFAVWGWVA